MTPEAEAAIRERVGRDHFCNGDCDGWASPGPCGACVGDTKEEVDLAIVEADRRDLLAALDAARAELDVQWAANHDEHCGHVRPEAICTWPRPAALRSPQ